MVIRVICNSSLLEVTLSLLLLAISGLRWKLGQSHPKIIPIVQFDAVPTQSLSFFQNDQRPVVRRLISANPGLNFNPGLFYFSSKPFSGAIFSILFRVTNHQIVDKKN